jgi:hypothetical protein
LFFSKSQKEDHAGFTGSLCNNGTEKNEDFNYRPGVRAFSLAELKPYRSSGKLLLRFN